MEEKKKTTFGFINFKWGLNAALLILLSFLVCSLTRTPKWLFHIFFLFKSIFFLSCLSFSGCLINTLAFLLWSPLLVPLSIPVIVLLLMNHLTTYWLQTNYYILKLFFNQTLRTVPGIITALNKSYLFKSFEWNRLEWYVWVIISSFPTFSLSGTPINPEQDL